MSKDKSKENLMMQLTFCISKFFFPSDEMCVSKHLWQNYIELIVWPEPSFINPVFRGVIQTTPL